MAGAGTTLETTLLEATLLEATLLEATGVGVIPVVEVDGVAEADALAETLLEAGLGVIEVTFRTHAAAKVIARIAQRFPDMVVGAGTVIGEQDLRRAAEAGARLAPGLSTRTLDQAARVGLPYVPSAVTPSDLQAGIERGVRMFKFFQAVPAGGIPFLRSIAALFGLHGLRFIPTGGMSPANLADRLGEPSVAAVGGTWIANRSMIRGGDWAGIRRAAEDALRTVRAVREAA